MQLPEALSACGKVSEKVKVLELSKGKVSSCRSLLVNLAMLPNSRGSPLGVLYSRRRHGALLVWLSGLSSSLQSTKSLV